MRRRRFLLVSYFYPPHGGAGVQRALHLSRLAPARGWDPVVLASSHTGTTAMDPSLLSKVPPEVRVERTPAVLTDGLQRALGRVRLQKVTRAVPVDRYVGWLPFAWRRLRALLRETTFDLVFSTSSPYTAHLVGSAAKAQLRCPWVCDLRDPWTDNRFLPVYREEDPFARFRQRVDRRLERRVYERADAITVTAGPLRDLLIRDHGLASSKVHLVRNGYDADEFLDVPPSPKARGGPFRLLFAGSMYGEYNLEAAFASCERLLERRPDVDLELCIVSSMLGWARREAPRFPLLAKRLVLRDAVSHDEIVPLYRSADVLVLSALDPLSVPGKLYEYIAAGPPVLAFVAPDTDAERLLAETGAGLAVPAGDAERGAAAIERLYDAGTIPTRDEARVRQLTRQAQVDALVDLFDSLCPEW